MQSPRFRISEIGTILDGTCTASAHGRSLPWSRGVSDMSSLIAQLATGNGLLLASAVALPLVARWSRFVPRKLWTDVAASSWALLITAAVGFGFIELVMATGAMHGMLRYGYVTGEILAGFAVFSLAWWLLGPGRSKSDVSGIGPMASPGV